MSHDHASTGEHKPHVLPIRVYATVALTLFVMTYLTVKVSYMDFGTLNIVVAMGIACFKASLVVLFFMHLKYDEKFNVLIFVGSLGFLGIFFILTLADTMERGRVDPIEAREIELVPARPELLEGHGDDGHDAGEGTEGTSDATHGAEADGHEGEGATTDAPVDDAGDSGGH